MGESVRIKDLIYKMINFSGYSVKDESNPDGDIEVRIIGLRPGEKLYEEFFIGDDSKNTDHFKNKTTRYICPFVRVRRAFKKFESFIG